MPADATGVELHPKLTQFELNFALSFPLETRHRSGKLRPSIWGDTLKKGVYSAC